MTDISETQVSLTLEEKKALTATTSSEALAAHVVAYRVLGIQKDFAVHCMQELSRRKDTGDLFDFEQYIEANVQKMPKPQQIDMKQMSAIFNIQNISSLLKKK